MKQFTLLLAAILTSGSALAALDPIHQKAVDLSNMVAFITNHPEVMLKLQSIDFENRIVHFGKDCIATFDRVDRFAHLPIDRPRPTGPADPLQFISATCPIGSPRR